MKLQVDQVDKETTTKRGSWSPQAMHRNLRENGRKKLIDFTVDDSVVRKPAWLDEERFLEARKVIKKYQLGIEFSSLTGLLVLLQCPDALEPLLSTGQSKDIPSLFNRYLNTVLHVRTWYDYDIFESQTKGFKSIRQVRSMHKRLQQIMNDKFTVSNVQGKEQLWMTQYEVSVTQFSFIGLAVAKPKKCGLIGASNKELVAINYYWRVLGFMMGLDDEFNCCQFDNLEEIQEIMNLILEHDFKVRLMNEPCPNGLYMCQGICIALKDFISMVTFNSLAHWWSDEFMFNGYELQPMTLKEKCLTNLTKLSFGTLFKYKACLNLSTKLHMLKFARKLKKRDQIYRKLKAKYGPDGEKLVDKSKNEKYLFYSDRIDYFGNKPTPTTKNVPNGETEKKSPQEPPISTPLSKANGCPFGFVYVDKKALDNVPSSKTFDLEVC